MLTGALIVIERVRRALLAQHVYFKFGRPLQPAFKVLHEMAFGHVQARGRRWGGHDAADRPAPASVAIDDAFHDARRPNREVGFDRHEGQDGNGRGPLRVEHLAPAVGIERDRRIVVRHRGGDQHLLVAGPCRAMRGHGEVDLERDRRLDLALDRVLGRGVLRRDFPERPALVVGQEGLELQLVLAIGRDVELRLQIGPKRGVLEPFGEHLGERFGTLGIDRAGGNRCFGRRRHGPVAAGGDEDQRHHSATAVQHGSSW